MKAPARVLLVLVGGAALALAPALASTAAPIMPVYVMAAVEEPTPTVTPAPQPDPTPAPEPTPVPEPPTAPVETNQQVTLAEGQWAGLILLGTMGLFGIGLLVGVNL